MVSRGCGGRGGKTLRASARACVCVREALIIFLCVSNLTTSVSSPSTPSPSPLSSAASPPPPDALFTKSSEKASFCGTLVPSPRQPPKRNASCLLQKLLPLPLPSTLLSLAGTDTIAWLNRGPGGGHDFRPRWSGVTVPSCRRTTASCGWVDAQRKKEVVLRSACLVLLIFGRTRDVWCVWKPTTAAVDRLLCKHVASSPCLCCVEFVQRICDRPTHTEALGSVWHLCARYSRAGVESIIMFRDIISMCIISIAAKYSH